MLVLLLILVVGAVAFGVGSVALGRNRGFDDVERFHRARGITTEWARRGVTAPVLVDDAHDSGHSPAPDADDEAAAPREQPVAAGRRVAADA